MIPKQISELPLIRVCRPDCRSHQDCDSPGKRPVSSTKNAEPSNRIKSWLNRGGNYGVVARQSNELVVFDSDSIDFTDLLEDNLPPTFRVQSGGDGHGEHWYYRCSEAERQTGWSAPEGSVRVRNWHVVGPGSTHPDTGNEYQIVDEGQIATVSQDQLQTVYDILDDQDGDVKRGGGGSAAPAPAASSQSDRLDFIRRADKRRDIANVLSGNSSHEERVWMVGWLHGAAGLQAHEIVDIILAEATWPNLDRDVVEEQVESVIRSSRSERGTHYSKFGTADMDASASERRKTERTTEDRESSVKPEVTTYTTMAQADDSDYDNVVYDDLYEAVLQEASDDGDRFKKVCVVERQEDGDKSQFLSLKQGNVKEQTLANKDEAVLVEDVNSSIPLKTRPENIDDLIAALNELKEKIDD